MKIKQKVTNEKCATLVGVGRPTIIAVKKMLGIGGSRKVYAESIADFLEKHPDFQIADVDDMVAFRKRHPKFVIPGEDKLAPTTA